MSLSDENIVLDEYVSDVNHLVKSSTTRVTPSDGTLDAANSSCGSNAAALISSPQRSLQGLVRQGSGEQIVTDCRDKEPLPRKSAVYGEPDEDKPRPPVSTFSARGDEANHNALRAQDSTDDVLFPDCAILRPSSEPSELVTVNGCRSHQDIKLADYGAEGVFRKPRPFSSDGDLVHVSGTRTSVAANDQARMPEDQLVLADFELGKGARRKVFSKTDKQQQADTIAQSQTRRPNTFEQTKETMTYAEDTKAREETEEEPELTMQQEKSLHDQAYVRQMYWIRDQEDVYDQNRFTDSSRSTSRSSSRGSQSRSSPSRDSPSRDSPSRDSPSRDSPSRDSPSRDSPSRDSPSRDSPSRDSPSRDSPSRDSPSRDSAFRRLPPCSPSTRSRSRESPSRESPSRESPSRASPSRDSPSRDSPSSHSPSSHSPSRHMPSRHSPSRISRSRGSPTMYFSCRGSSCRSSPSKGSPSKFSSDSNSPFKETLSRMDQLKELDRDQLESLAESLVMRLEVLSEKADEFCDEDSPGWVWRQHYQEVLADVEEQACVIQDMGQDKALLIQAFHKLEFCLVSVQREMREALESADRDRYRVATEMAMKSDDTLVHRAVDMMNEAKTNSYKLFCQLQEERDKVSELSLLLQQTQSHASELQEEIRCTRLHHVHAEHMDVPADTTDMAPTMTEEEQQQQQQQEEEEDEVVVVDVDLEDDMSGPVMLPPPPSSDLPTTLRCTAHHFTCNQDIVNFVEGPPLDPAYDENCVGQMQRHLAATTINNQQAVCSDLFHQEMCLQGSAVN